MYQFIANILQNFVSLIVTIKIEFCIVLLGWEEHMLKKYFVHAGTDYSTMEKQVPAPYFRRNFEITKKVKKASILICGLGFYELYVNGVHLTKGYLAPYRSNHNHFLYMDEYDLTDYLIVGKNVVAILLGNGMQNPFGGFVWGFDKPCILFPALVGRRDSKSSRDFRNSSRKWIRIYHGSV